MSELEETEELLSLEDLALLIDGVEGAPDRMLDRLSTTIRTDARFAKQFAVLECLADEAGLAPETSSRFTSAIGAHGDVDRLLEAEGWRHPAEVLDPDGDRGILYPVLTRIVAARVDRADDPGLLLRVQEKLGQAYADEQADETMVTRFVEALRRRDKGTAQRLLYRADRQWRQTGKTLALPGEVP